MQNVKQISDDDIQVCKEYENYRETIIPESNITRHEAHNPFISSAEDDQKTNRCVSFPQKMRANWPSFKSIEYDIEPKSLAEIPLSVSSCVTQSGELSCFQSAANLIKGMVYQTSLNKELILQFTVLRELKPIQEKTLKLYRAPLKAHLVHSQKKTLVLDLDGTLICPCSNPKNANQLVVERTRLTVVNKNKQSQNIDFYMRPLVKKFLRTMSLYYEIIVSIYRFDIIGFYCRQRRLCKRSG